MFKRLMMSFVHLGVMLAAIVIFTTLAETGVLSEQSVPAMPPDYTYLKGMYADELAKELKAKNPEILGLITFDRVPNIVVLGAGFERNRIVVNAEVGEMVKLAEAANLPVTSVACVSPPGEHGAWFFLPLTALILWMYFAIQHSSTRAEQYIRKQKYSGVKLWLTVLAITTSMLALVSVSRVLHDAPFRLAPAEYREQHLSPAWEMYRALGRYPQAFQRAIVIDGTNVIAVVLRFPDSSIVGWDAENKDDGNDKTPAPPMPVTVARVILFERTPADNEACTIFVSALRANNVPVTTVPGELHNGWAETMGPSAIFRHIVFAAVIVLLQFQMVAAIKQPDLSRDVKAAKGYASQAVYLKEDSVDAGSGQLQEKPEIKSDEVTPAGGSATTTNQPVQIAARSRTTLADVAGCHEAVAKLRLVVEWMKDAKAYEHYGAKLPNGVLLYGPPGTGKTLLARAVAGEIDGNFFHASASEFVEMYVGVGARRVRDFFAQGTKAYRETGKISVLFMDELDAVGKKRSDGGTGADSERDQTVNQLLTCIQGFDTNTGCLLIAATNRFETLDEGLKRSGRFDFKIEVAKPDRKGRQAIFRIHGAKADLEPGVDREQLYMELARRAHDFTGADIELAINEALTIAAKRNSALFAGKSAEEIAKMPRIVSRADFNDGVDFVLYGQLIKSRVRTNEERWATAVHEIGHATIPTVNNGDPVERITIVMTTKSLGLMESYTEEERYGWSKDQLLQRIKTMLAGRAAEELIAGEISTGASNDFERASQLARFMVGVYGMSSLGVISIPLDQYGFPRAHIGQRLEVEFDEAWRSIIRDCDKETRSIINAHREQILACAKALLDEETVTGDRFREVWAANAPGLAGTADVTDAQADPKSGQAVTADEPRKRATEPQSEALQC